MHLAFYPMQWDSRKEDLHKEPLKMVLEPMLSDQRPIHGVSGHI